MEILIWGTGEKGKAAKRICDKLSQEVSAFIDNDKSNWGILMGIPVLAPDYILSKPSKDTQVWIATKAEEVYEQAKELTCNVLEWKYVQMIIQSQNERPPYPEVQLNNQNIQNCRLLKDRKLFLKQFAMQAMEWKMAEVGVAFGDFSEQILKICSPQKLYLIDCWEDERYGAGEIYIQNKFRKEIEVGTIEVCKGYSIQKLAEFDDNELDWVYIDTIHDYEMTKNELELSQKKVKSGGYICGHDYAKFNVYSRYDYGVYDAVNEFAVNYGYEFLYLTMEKHGLQSFCLRKIVERT